MDKALVLLALLVLAVAAIYPPRPLTKYEKIKSTLFYTLGVLEKHEIPATIFYGTLLGWYRDGDIIKGDQDADILIFDPDFDKLSSIKGIEVIDDKLARVFNEERDTYVDLYHAVIEDDHVRVLTNDASCVKIPKDLVLPLKGSTFLGRDVAIPSKPYEWLRFQYGDDFMTPKEYKGKTCV
jgi:hypothetical protein